MIQENEVVMALLGIGVLVFIMANRLPLKHLPASEILIVGFYMLLTSWILTVLEGFFWGNPLNFLEHMCYAGSAVLVVAWCWRVFGRRRGGDEPHRHY